MAKRRELSYTIGDERKAYFEQEIVPFDNKGRREIKPLHPFIISGGENTERYYFLHVSDVTKYKFIVQPEYFGMESNYTEIFPQRIDKILKDNADAKIFCVFDWDTIRGHQKNLEKHTAFVNQYKSEIDSGKVVLCPSMPSIEYWFLLHFENTTELIKTCGRTLQNRLTPYMLSYFPDTGGKKLLKVLKSEEYVGESVWVEKLCEDGKMKDAIQRAENNIKAAELAGNLDDQSYSFVYLPFKQLKGE